MYYRTSSCGKVAAKIAPSPVDIASYFGPSFLVPDALLTQRSQLKCSSTSLLNKHQHMLTMSAEVQPPSPPGQGPSHLHKDKHSKSPPISFNTRSARRGHIRSSSFGGFVSRLLPSRRREKGYTSRSEFNDEDTRDPVGLVFSLSDSQHRKDLPGSKNMDQAVARKTRRCSPRKTSSSSNDTWALGSLNNDQPHGISNQLEQSARVPDRDEVEISKQSRRTGRNGIQIASNAAGTRKVDSLRRMFGSIKLARGETRNESKYSEPSSSQPPQIKEPRLGPPDIFSDEKEITKTQQIFDEKRSRREQRRSLRESGDFLGVQGANPRTGYWDISDATSSSEPSQMSEETKLKLHQQAKELAEQKRKYEEAQESHQKQLMRVQTSKIMKKKEKGEQKKVELKMKQRRHGKWRLTENGWSSVVEPELSPIQQSVAGSPVAGKSKAMAVNRHG